MDFWDVTRLMWRRWYIAVPMLLVTCASTLWVGASVEPDYQVTGRIAMVGSTVARPEDQPATVNNPWTVESLAEAAAFRLEGKALADEMAAVGHQGSWSVGVTGRQPWLTLEVVASTPQAARATLTQLKEVVAEEVRNRQDDYQIPVEEQITVLRLEQGETVETLTTKLRRALVVVLGVGLLATMGVVVAFDAIARRWWHGRTAAVPAEPEPRPRYQFTTATARAEAAAPAAGRVDGHPNNGAQPAPAVFGEEYPLAVRAVTPAAQATEPDPLPAPEAPEEPPTGPQPSGSDDTTIVLPLSHAPWAGRPRGDRGAG